jgi:hypothetical protein
MLLNNYDLYDLYAVFVLIRAYPSDQANALAVDAVKEVLDAPQAQFGSTNAIRSRLGHISQLDREKWFFVDTQNVYTYMPPFLKDEKSYAILSACLAEMQEAMTMGNTERIYDLADAIHNIPIILTKGGHSARADITREISYVYRKKWNEGFLKALL